METRFVNDVYEGHVYEDDFPEYGDKILNWVEHLAEISDKAFGGEELEVGYSVEFKEALDSHSETKVAELFDQADFKNHLEVK